MKYCYIIEIFDGDPVYAVCSNPRRAMQELRELGESVTGSQDFLRRGEIVAHAYNGAGDVVASAYRFPISR